MKVLALCLIIMSSAFAQVRPGIPLGKSGGNGQLVVIPKDHTKPVPYEAVRAWETGFYRNWENLPCINGNTDPREKFNKNYACYAEPWLEMIKEASPVLHQKLMNAGDKTHFRYINHFIKWEHEEYPEGELDYKKYEKAAFFNGEIIFSIPVMDSIGPLDTVLTKEQNMGYIFVHELINAAFPHKEVKWKLNLGEIFLQKEIFKFSHKETLIRLLLAEPRLIFKDEDRELLLEIFKEIDPNKYSNEIYVLENFLIPGVSFGEGYVELLKKSVAEGKNFDKSHSEIIEIIKKSKVPHKEIKVQFSTEIVNNVYDEIPQMDLYEFCTTESYRGYRIEVLKKMMSKSYATVIDNKLKNMRKLDTELFSLQAIAIFKVVLGNYKDLMTYESVSNMKVPPFRSVLNRGLEKSFGTCSIYDLTIVKNSYPQIVSKLSKFLSENLSRAGMNFEKSMSYNRWVYSMTNSGDYIYQLPPLTREDRLFIVDSVSNKGTLYEYRGHTELDLERYELHYKTDGKRNGKKRNLKVSRSDQLSIMLVK